jgi:hypothetical protein
MSMVIMHMAMVIATVVELNIHNLDTGAGRRLSNRIRKNCVEKKKNFYSCRRKSGTKLER